MAIVKEAGAKASKVGIHEHLRAYFLDHHRIAKQSLRRLLQQPVNSLMTWLVIGIALALPVSMYVGIANMQALSSRWDGDARISVFLRHEIAAQEAEKIAEEIRQWSGVSGVRLITSEEGLAEFQELSGLPDVLGKLEENPLPIVFEVLPTAEYRNAQEIETLLHKLQVLPQAEQVQLDLEWVKRLHAILQIGEKITLVLVLMLSLGVLLVIGNTIRLEIENRRREIIVVKLIGATDTFIRRPFLYTGFWYGLGGGCLASIIVALGLAVVSKPVANLAGLYESDYALLYLSLADILALWTLSGLLGFFGAWFAVGKHLDELEPE